MAKRAKPRHFTDEFKRDAVRLMEKRGARTVAQVADDLGCSPDNLWKWAQQLGAQAAEEQTGCTENLEQEVRRLRKENAVLREEKAILKKAAAFFAKDNE